MRRLRISTALAALLTPLLATASASADPQVAQVALDDDSHPFLRFVENERAPTRFIAAAVKAGALRTVPRPAQFGTPAQTLDCVHAAHDIQLDPSSGATVARLDLRVRANGGSLSSIGLSLDAGLQMGAVTADGHAVTVSDSVVAPARIVQIAISPPLQEGESTTLHIPYEGTLGCGSYPEGGGILCTKGDDFSYFAHQSVIPYIFDPADPQSAGLDALTRDIVLRVPGGLDVVATGEKVSERIEGATKVSTWSIGHPLSRALGMYVFAGHLGLRDVPGRSVPTTFVFPNPERPVDKRLVSWSAGVLDFVEGMGGGALPFQKSLTLVRLPAHVGDPGTATFGMTLLSESYARNGDLMHEETWAHENSHLFWGIVVPETSSAESRMLSEGLATLTEIDYTWATHFAGTDRDTYLAQRFVPIGLDLRALGKTLPPIRLAAGELQPDGYRTSLYTLWAYYKTSATLDHLRVTIGDDVFARGLAAYVKKCSYVGCSPDDLRTVMQDAAGKDLRPFFDRWVNASSRPDVTVGFEPVKGGADIELTKADASAMTLELWLKLDDGQLVKRRVDLAGRKTRVHIDTGSWVRNVMTSPRHDVLVSAKSAAAGDLDFDGESDGIDLLRCTPLVGKSYSTTNAVGLWNVAERFDPRCDVNGDLRIDDDDIALIADSFGTFRGSR